MMNMFRVSWEPLGRDEIEGVSSAIQRRLDEDALILMGVSVGDEKGPLDAVFFGTVAEKNI
jgi:hypothetical protein